MLSCSSFFWKRLAISKSYGTTSYAREEKQFLLWVRETV